MSRFWEGIAERTNGETTADDFEAASYRLLAEQALYFSDRGSRSAYLLIERFEREFRQVVDALGVTLQLNRQLRYACAIPRHPKSPTATVEQTVLALVLRKLYDEGARAGNMTESGEIYCDLVELAEKYKVATHRELPDKGRLDALLRQMKRWGIARIEEIESQSDAIPRASEQPYVVVIRPAIADVLGEAAIARLAHWHSAAGANPSEPEPASHARNKAGGDETEDRGVLQ